MVQRRLDCRNVFAGPWERLTDENGNVLEGIWGRTGAVGITQDGTNSGIDLILMDPGRAFRLHVHPGDHYLFCYSGQGILHVEGTDYSFVAGATEFIPAELPHSVRNVSQEEALIFIAVGFPHTPLGNSRRMRYIGEDAPSCAGCGAMMIREGSYHKCLNCGATRGCQ